MGKTEKPVFLAAFFRLPISIFDPSSTDLRSIRPFVFEEETKGAFCVVGAAVWSVGWSREILRRGDAMRCRCGGGGVLSPELIGSL